ncbi:MAG: hypothetical protein GQ558_07995 [Thermoplasmata archaeon]|nr:hypothetical protein [Thermoplasmata archaeon]
MTIVTFLAVVIAISSNVASEDGRISHEPIIITGDEEMDGFPDWASGDGLTAETAYVLEGFSIDGIGEASSISISMTNRHLIIRDCELLASDGSQDPSVVLDDSRNITITECDFPGSGSAILLQSCRFIIVKDNRITNQSIYGIHLEGSEIVSIKGNKVDDSDQAIVLRGSDNVVIDANEISSSDTGIQLTSSNGCQISDNEIRWHERNGILLNNADDNEVIGNLIHGNGWTGLQISDSHGNLVIDNQFTENYRGVWLTDCSGTSLQGNNLTGNEAVGVRLTDSDDNTFDRNNLKGNGNVGMELIRSNGNTFTSNNITTHINGISFTRSTGNLFKDNRLIANVWTAYAGDTTGNTFEDNVLRANSWLRGLVAIIVGLIVVGGVLGTRSWLKRRKREKVEKGKVLIKRRFPAGRDGLWAMSMILWDEELFRSQLEAAGPQREQILERYAKSISSARTMQYMLVGIMCFMLAFMAAIPLAGLLNIITMDIDGTTVNDALFATGMAIGLYQTMSLVIMLVFGLLFLAQLMKGDIFHLLASLPMDQKGNQRVVLYMLFRMYGAPFIVMLLAFPVGGFLLTWSVTFLVVSILVNALLLVFIAFALVLVSDALARRVFSANATRGATVLRIAVMGSYIVIMMSVSLALTYMIRIVSDLYVTQRLAGGDGDLINAVMSIIPFPFSGGYLVALSVIPSGEVAPMIYVTTAIGLGILALMTYGVRRVGLRVLERVAKGQEMPGVGPGHVASVGDIKIATRKPISAFMRNSILVSSRDMGSLVYLIMPIMLPFIMIVSLMSDSEIGMFDPVVPYLFYLGTTPFLINMALSTADAQIGGILSAIPFRMMDLFRSKWNNIVILMAIPLFVIIILLYNQVPESTHFVILMISILPMMLVLASLYLMSYSLAFGTMNGKHTFFMSRIDNKLLKYIGIIALQYIVVITEIGVFWSLYRSGTISYEAGIAGLWIVNLALFGVLEVAARRMFD